MIFKDATENDVHSKIKDMEFMFNNPKVDKEFLFEFNRYIKMMLSDNPWFLDRPLNIKEKRILKKKFKEFLKVFGDINYEEAYGQS